MSYQSDAHYISAIKKGDSQAFAALVDKHKSMVFGICVKIVRKSEIAEELAQDVFVKVYQKLAGFREESKFSTWLYRIAYNAAISHTRKKQIETSGIDDFVFDNYTVDDEQAQLQRLNKEAQLVRMQSALQQMKPQEAFLIQMFYQEDMSVRQIGELMAITEANVKVKLHRARKKLYSLMVDDEQ